MAKRISRPPTSTEHTIAWFEETLRTHSLTTGLLDTANSSMLTIAEISGGLVGAWRRYCGRHDDLDIPAIAEALGALLVAVGRTAASLDLSLDDLLVQQVAQLATAPAPKGTKSKTARSLKTPLPAVPEALPIGAPSPTAPTRRRPRPLATPSLEDPAAPDTGPGRTKQRKAPAASLTPPANRNDGPRRLAQHK